MLTRLASCKLILWCGGFCCQGFLMPATNRLHRSWANESMMSPAGTCPSSDFQHIFPLHFPKIYAIQSPFFPLAMYFGSIGSPSSVMLAVLSKVFSWMPLKRHTHSSIRWFSYRWMLLCLIMTVIPHPRWQVVWCWTITCPGAQGQGITGTVRSPSRGAKVTPELGSACFWAPTDISAPTVAVFGHFAGNCPFWLPAMLECLLQWSA